MMLSFDAFSNALRSLHCIDSYDLYQVLPRDRVRDIWTEFRDDPVRVLLRLGDAEARAVFSILERRQPKREHA